MNEITGWEQVKLLSVQINRLRRWHRPGLLCIGDAAHAMSPAGGVGINLAIQDAVATANILTEPLLRGDLRQDDLARVQCRREFPTRITQAVQAFAHQQLVRVFDEPGPARAPWQLKVAVNIPGIQHVMGHAVGMGARPEHINGAKRECRLSTMTKLAIGAGAFVGAFLAVRRLQKR